VRLWKLKWGLGKRLRSWDGHERERRCEFTGAANGGRRQTAVLLGCARGKKGEGFHRPDDASGRFRPSFMAYRSNGMGAEAAATCGGPSANGGRRFARQRVRGGRMALA
jgi:hypothetical protein